MSIGLCDIYLRVNTCVTPGNIRDFWFTPLEKNCLDSNLVIWRFFGFGPSWILTVQNRWYDKGKPKFSQIIGAKVP